MIRPILLILVLLLGPACDGPILRRSRNPSSESLTKDLPRALPAYVSVENVRLTGDNQKGDFRHAQFEAVLLARQDLFERVPGVPGGDTVPLLKLVKKAGDRIEVVGSADAVGSETTWTWRNVTVSLGTLQSMRPRDTWPGTNYIEGSPEAKAALEHAAEQQASRIAEQKRILQQKAEQEASVEASQKRRMEEARAATELEFETRRRVAEEERRLLQLKADQEAKIEAEKLRQRQEAARIASQEQENREKAEFAALREQSPKVVPDILKTRLQAGKRYKGFIEGSGSKAVEMLPVSLAGTTVEVDFVIEGNRRRFVGKTDNPTMMIPKEANSAAPANTRLPFMDAPGLARMTVDGTGFAIFGRFFVEGKQQEYLFRVESKP